MTHPLTCTLCQFFSPLLQQAKLDHLPPMEDEGIHNILSTLILPPFHPLSANHMGTLPMQITHILNTTYSHCLNSISKQY